jgi:hypothetical protein
MVQVRTRTPRAWNDIAAEFVRDANFSEVRAARAFALLNMVEHNAAVACWDTKYFYFIRPPITIKSSYQDRSRSSKLPCLRLRTFNVPRALC